MSFHESWHWLFTSPLLQLGHWIDVTGQHLNNQNYIRHFTWKQHHTSGKSGKNFTTPNTCCWKKIFMGWGKQYSCQRRSSPDQSALGAQCQAHRLIWFLPSWLPSPPLTATGCCTCGEITAVQSWPLPWLMLLCILPGSSTTWELQHLVIFSNF